MKRKCANQQKLLNILILVFFSLEALGKGNEASLTWVPLHLGACALAPWYEDAPIKTIYQLKSNWLKTVFYYDEAGYNVFLTKKF